MYEHIHVICPLCQLDDAKKIYRKRSISIVRCRHCRFIYQDPVNKISSDIDNIESYYKQYLAASEFQERLFQNKFEEFLSHPSNGTVLDIGCGVGTFLKVARGQGWNPYGVDVSPWVCASLSEHGYKNIYNCNLEDAKFNANYFDAINMNHVLEHIPSPLDFLIEANRILKPGGIILIEVPNERRFPYNYMIINMVKPKHMAPRYTPEKHFNLFTKYTLKTIIEKSGFKPLVIREEGFVSGNRLKTPALSKKNHLTRLALLFSRLRLDLLLGLGRYIVAAAKKP